MFDYQEKKEDELYWEEIIKMKDAGINYQRIKVGLNEKGKSDLGNRLFYKGNREKDRDIEYWKGTDINEFYIESHTNRFVRTNIELKDNERVILNKEYFSIKPKLLWRQTAPYPIAAIDKNGIWFGRSIQEGVINEIYKNKFYYEYLCCLLNSNYIRNLYIRNVKETGKVFPQVKLDKLKKIQVKVIKIEEQEEYKKIYEQLQIKKKAREDRIVLIEKLNNMIYDLYNVSSEERKEINKMIGEKKDEQN